MAAMEIFVGDVGTVLQVDCGADISQATVLKVIAKPPYGAKKEWVGTLNGTNIIDYTLLAGDIHVGGTWRVQSYIELPNWQGRGEWANLEVNQ